MKLPAGVLSFLKRYGSAGRFAVRIILGTLPGAGVVADAVDKILEAAVETGKDSWEADQAALAQVDSETLRRSLEALDSLGGDLKTLLVSA